MGLTARQKQIAEIVRAEGPITGQRIADQLHVTRAALRSDLAILIMSGIIDARPKVGYYFIGRSTLGLLTEEVSDILVSDIQSMPVVILNTKSAYEAIISMFVEDERDRDHNRIYQAAGSAEAGDQYERGYENDTRGHGYDPVVQNGDGIPGYNGVCRRPQGNRQPDRQPARSQVCK